MTNYYDEGSTRSRAGGRSLPDHGVTAESNPGETGMLLRDDSADAGRIAATGAGQARRNPTGDIGSQVGVLRNLEYSAGGRSHRISTGPYTSA